MKDEAKKIVGVLGLILAIIGCFLPFASISFIGTININYIQGDGKIVLALLIIGALFFLINIKGVAATLCVISLMVVGYDIYNLYNVVNTYEYGSLANMSIGPILIIIGCVATIYGCITSEKKVKVSNEVGIKYCSNCGAQLRIDSIFCDKCGSQQKKK